MILKHSTNSINYKLLNEIITLKTMPINGYNCHSDAIHVCYSITC